MSSKKTAIANEQEDGKAGLKTFRVFYVLTVPGEAKVLAKNAKEAAEKLNDWDVEEHTDHELASELEIDDIEEVDEK